MNLVLEFFVHGKAFLFHLFLKSLRAWLIRFYESSFKRNHTETIPCSFVRILEFRKLITDKTNHKHRSNLTSLLTLFEQITSPELISSRQLRQFIEECIIEDDSILSITEMYAHFKEWFKEGWPNMSLPIKNEVKEYFEKLWGELGTGSKWKGYRIRTLQDDINDGEVVVMGEDDFINYGNDDKALPPM